MPDIFRWANKKREDNSEKMTSTGETIEVKKKEPVKQGSMSQADFSKYPSKKPKGK